MGAISVNVALVKAAATAVYGPLAAGKSATLNINVCNRSTTSAKVRVAISATPVPADKDYFEFDAPATQAAPLLRTGETLKAGDYVVVYTDGEACSVRVSGYDETE